MLAKIYCFLRGYVEIIVKSRFIERFINICIRRNIYLWDIHRKNEYETNMKMSMRSFHKIRPIAKKTHSRVRICKKGGMPMIFHKYKKRYFFMWGFIVALCFITVMSQFVWSIEIVGNERVEREKILDALASLGLKKGAYAKGFDARDLKNKALLELDELSWIWVDIKGSRAIVNVNEKTPAPEMIPKNEVCDIVASRDGVIKDITIKEGQSRIEIGQTVMKGQLLISGVIKSERISERYTRSSGDVYARTWYEATNVYPLSRQIRTPTGKKISQNSLCIGNMHIDFFLKNKNLYENYDVIEQRHDLVIFGKYMGISWEERQYQEVEITYEQVSCEYVLSQAEEELKKQIIPDTKENAVLQASEITYIHQDDENIKVTLTQEYCEQIGVEKKIETIFNTP